MKANKELDLNFIDKLQDELADMAVGGRGYVVHARALASWGCCRSDSVSTTVVVALHGGLGKKPQRQSWSQARDACGGAWSRESLSLRALPAAPPHPAHPPIPQDLTNDINEMMGQSFAVPEDVDEGDLMAELDALEGDMMAEPAAGGVPSYLQVRVSVFVQERVCVGVCVWVCVCVCALACVRVQVCLYVEAVASGSEELGGGTR
jgi:hypothetical protein